MARSSNAPAPRKDRWQAVFLKQHRPEWTLRQVAGKIGRSRAIVKKWNTCFEVHGTVADQLRSGRPQKVSTEAAQQATTATQDLDCKTAGAIAVTAQQQSGVKMSLSTTTCYLRKPGLQHLRPRTMPILTAKDKAARLASAKAVRSSFQRALITDSKTSDWLLWEDHQAGGALQLQEAQWANQSTVRVYMSIWACPAELSPP